MKKIIQLLLITVAFTLTSCQDYLDIKPYGLTIPKTAEEFSALMHNRLANIEEGADYALLPKASVVLEWELYGDNFEPLLAAPNITLPFYIGGKIESTTRVQPEYTRLYEIIRDCNIVIEGMPDEESEIANNTLGTAYALRGVAYYQLMRLYCEPVGSNPESQLGVPLATEFNMEVKLPRATLAQTIDQILQDLSKALTFKITHPDYLFNEDVVNGYLARTYFWVGDWANARSTAERLLQKHPLVSGDTYTGMFQPGMMSGNTLIKVIYSASSSSEQVYLNQLHEGFPLSNRFLSHFPEEERETDIRYDLSVGSRRLTSRHIFSGMRSAEMLLIAAESAYHMGDETAALNMINDLRANRIKEVEPLRQNTLPPHNPMEYIKVDAKGNAVTPLLSMILSERRKELFMEGDRFFELKRNGRPTFWIPKNGLKYQVEEFMYTLPIPPADLLLYEGMIQNPGYEQFTVGANNKPINQQ